MNNVEKKLIAPFVLDILVATAGAYAAVSQLIDGFSWEAIVLLTTLTGLNVFAAFKLGTTEQHNPFVMRKDHPTLSRY